MLHEFWLILDRGAGVISAVAAAIQTLVIIIAAWLAIKQLRDAVRARSLTGFQAIWAELNGAEARGDRAFIFANEIDPADLDVEDRLKVERVCVTFDFIGVLVYHELVPRDVALSMYFDVVLRTWHRVRAFVLAERRRRGNVLYMMYFERLADTCDKYRRRRFPDEKLLRYFATEKEVPGMYQPFIVKALKDASKIARRSFGSVSGMTKTGDPNQVLTETDLAIGRHLVDLVQESFPGDNLIDEEAGVIDKGSSMTWVIDPIDGTSNFAAGVPLFGIMLGLLDDGIPVAGGIALPAFGRICTAERGQGAWINGQRISVDRSRMLTDTLIAYGIDGHRESPQLTRDESALLAELVLACRNVRASNSAYDAMMVAEGRYGAYLNRTSKIWDNVAPQIVIEEAGGLYTDFFGAPIDYTTPLQRAEDNFTFCAAPPDVHAELQTIIHAPRATISVG